MFKKTLIAAALATTALSAAASDVTTTATTLGVEYAQGIEQIVAADVVFEPERDYDSGDIITISYAGATVAEETNAATPVSITPTVTGAGDFLNNVEFLEYDGNDIKLLVTNPVDSTVAGTQITISGQQLILTAAADEGQVKVSAFGKVDTVEGAKTVDIATAVTYITYATEIGSEVSTAFDGVVDVNESRKAFVGGGTADTLVITNTQAAVTTGVTPTGAIYTVYGDFSFLDEDGDEELGGTDDGTITSSGGTVEVAEDFMSAKISSTSFAAGTVGVTVTGPDEVVIPDQTFTVSTVVSYSDPAGGATDLTTTTLNNASAGAWTLNGAQAHIPFLPFGSAYSQSVTVSNTSSQTGGVDLVIYTGGDTVEVEGIATVAAEGVTDLSSAIRNAVSDAGLTGNLSFDVIINAPDSSITVEALYYAKADADRLRTL